MKRIPIAIEGHRPYRVSVFVERGRVWCKWTVKGEPKFKSWPDSRSNRKAAQQWGRRYAAERLAMDHPDEPAAPAAPITLRDLWARYQHANAKDWRPKTAKGYAQHFAVLEDVLGGGRAITEIGLEDVDRFKVTRREAGIAHSQVRRQIGFLRQLLNWAEGRDLLLRNRLRSYRYSTPKDEREAPPDEYSRAELLAIAAQLGARRHWRARGIIALCGTLGARINAVLHLSWKDVDLEADTVTWRAAWDKLGEERIQPLTPLARAALVEASQERHESEPWVFWAVRAKGKPFHYNSVVHHLWEAEKRAGVAHRPGREFHGLRRMVVGDVGISATPAPGSGRSP